jgi:NAD(P)H dehydrogenase (quinone)
VLPAIRDLSHKPHGRNKVRETRDALANQPDNLWTAVPIQNAAAYDIPALTLRADVAPKQPGFSAHIG